MSGSKDMAPAVVVETEEDKCTKMFYRRYFTKNNPECRYHVVCLPDHRARDDPGLRALIKEHGGLYNARLSVPGKKGWLIENSVFPLFIEAFNERERFRKHRSQLFASQRASAVD